MYVIVVSDYGNSQIKLFTTRGQHLKTYGSHGNYDNELNRPMGVVVDEDGGILVCESENRRVVRFWEQDSKEMWKVILGKKQLNWGHPVHVAYDNVTETLVVGTREGEVRVYTYTSRVIY